MDLVFQALNFAAKAHLGQTRKKTDPELPYIIHPVAVALLVQKAGGDDETIMASLLHDVIEDCEVTKEEIEKIFGLRVAEMVDDVTEQDTSLPWEERKRLAREHIKHMGHDSQLVKAADIIHNLSSVISAYEKNGMKIFKKFHAPLPDQKEMNKKRVYELEKAWPENPLLTQMKKIEEIFSNIK